MKRIMLSVILFILMTVSVYAEPYDAIVTTSSGVYAVPVEIVYSNKVTHVYWPYSNGDINHAMHVYAYPNALLAGVVLNDGYTECYNSRGQWLTIQIDDSDYVEYYERGY